MRVILFGATGMVGKGVLLEALDDPAVEKVLSISRSPLDVTHAKLEEVLHKDFLDFAPLSGKLAGFDACFFCLGVSSVGMNEADYARVTHDVTLAAAKAVLAASPQAVFTYVSGAGTDSTEKGRTMWARVKGRTENELLAMPFRGAFMFRPGFIRPLRGIKSKTGWYQAFYVALKPFGALLDRSASATTTTRIGLAMLECAEKGALKRVLDPVDINALAAARLARSLAPAGAARP